MIKTIIDDAGSRMAKTVESLRAELKKLRTGRAHPSLLEHIKVSYYGNDMPLNQVASIAIEDPRTLTVTPWEASMAAVIEKELRSCDLGLNPATAGTVIRVPLPPLTEERRNNLVRVVRDEAERSRVAIRNIRRDANNELKGMLKKKDISEDEERRAQTEIQKLTDRNISDVDKVSTAKETDLKEV